MPQPFSFIRSIGCDRQNHLSQALDLLLTTIRSSMLDASLLKYVLWLKCFFVTVDTTTLIRALGMCSRTPSIMPLNRRRIGTTVTFTFNLVNNCIRFQPLIVTRSVSKSMSLRMKGYPLLSLAHENASFFISPSRISKILCFTSGCFTSTKLSFPLSNI